ncbi:HNH endonuclease [Cupriavidus pinatubonensis]|uniref:HNH endonuclease n=1 Tax=Cupriavidus pinatubonensis TaxID=248026 RepID=UPI001CC3BB64|nr:hypothetical protein [Cupriavidus pinatubonensis]
MKLTIELVPTTCWYSNVRSNVYPATWDALQTAVFKAAGYRCEICGGRGHSHPVECHEIWEYDDHKRIQRLDHLASLCPNCHQVKHIGLAVSSGHAENVINWLAQVNQITPAQALAYAQHAFKIHAIRSRFNWSLDLRLLTTSYGIKLDKHGIEQGLNLRA